VSEFQLEGISVRVPHL